MRQIHHWAALVFLAAIVVHLCRIFFTGAFRRPREVNWIIGVTLLLLAIRRLHRLLPARRPAVGYGLRVVYSIVMSHPAGRDVAGVTCSSAGASRGPPFIARLFVIHVFFIPAADRRSC